MEDAKDRPHAYVEEELMAGSPMIEGVAMLPPYLRHGMPFGLSRNCKVCGGLKGDVVHNQTEAEAQTDAESPSWG